MYDYQDLIPDYVGTDDLLTRVNRILVAFRCYNIG